MKKSKNDVSTLNNRRCRTEILLGGKSPFIHLEEKQKISKPPSIADEWRKLHEFYHQKPVNDVEILENVFFKGRKIGSLETEVMAKRP